MVAPLNRARVLVARVAVAVAAPRARVWDALLDPIRYTPVTSFESEWREGAAVHWTGDLEGRHLEVDGVILRLEAPRLLAYQYTNPLSKAAHRVTIEVADESDGTRISVAEDGHATERELAHGEGGWLLMLHNLKAQLGRG